MKLLFDDTFYIMASEATLTRGYADLTMIVRPEMRRYQLLDLLIEFRYLALSDLGLSGEQVRSLSAAEMRSLPASSSKCDWVFDHRDHKERREATNLHLICRFFVFSVFSGG
ncbi:MAG: hypothetical protein WBV59_02260 [Anaerolineae bacterium]